MKKLVLFLGLVITMVSASASYVFCSQGTEGKCAENIDGSGFSCVVGGNDCGGTWEMKK